FTVTLARPASTTLFPYTTLFRSFGAGCNFGFERVLRDARRFRHVLLLNPDTIVERGTVAALVDVAERRPDAGIVGGNVLSIDGEDRKSTRLNSSHVKISYAVFCL